MALVFDNRAALQGKPGFHALIAGVSLYTHLPGGGGEKLTKEDWELSQLPSTALTAYKIYRWLIEHRNQFPVNLSTVRLLLSPSDKEKPEIEKGMIEISELLKNEPAVKLEKVASACTRKDFAREALLWKEDASSDDDNMTFFYFAGHGIERKNDDPVLLLEDFGDPDDGIVAKAVAFDKFRAGMVPSPNPQEKIARTQLYFIDACRVKPDILKDTDYPEISGVLRYDLGGRDNRSILICFGTVSNAKSYAAADQTLFSKSLIECLEGLGGEATTEEDEEGDAKWRIPIDKLSEAITAKGKEITARGLDQEFYPVRLGENKTVINLKEPPEIECFLFVYPNHALQFVAVDVMNYKNKRAWPNLSPVHPHPYRRRLPAGNYNVIATITNPPQPPYNDFYKSITVTPLGNRELKARLI
jgi:hypothetical protein